MINTLFLQSEVPDPYKLYKTMLYQNPVFWDSTNNIWSIYSYENCKAVLSDPAARIPPVNQDNKDGLNECALAISGRLARTSNGIQHKVSRKTALRLFENMQTVSSPEIITRLIPQTNGYNEIDWVNKVCKKLPVIVILKSFGLNAVDCGVISDNISQLIKIVLPGKTPAQVSTINSISKELWAIIETHLLTSTFYKTIVNELAEKYGTSTDEALSLCVSNLIGLLIQSYDAGRGILSNSLLQILNREDLHPYSYTNQEFMQKFVVETLRFDPPVHNTRRIATDNIMIDNHEIKKEQIILVVLAAANRDALKFNKPDNFNIERTNNAGHLTFGIGQHKCLAEHFSVNMATGALSFLFEKYKAIKLVEKDIRYEPMINARLPKNILISLIK